MSWIEDADEAVPDVAGLYARERATRGYVPDYTRVLAHRPRVLRAWEDLNGAVKATTDARRYELATLGAALRLRSSYCSLAHGRVLAEHHLDAGTVAAIAQGRADDVLDPVDAAVVRLADRVAAGAAAMTEDDLAELRDLGLGDEEILDVVLAAAARCFFSTVLDAVGARPDAAYRELDADLRDALTVGRPIAD
ncbi:carboxymuconolactone decarboxylase family protein [Actinotalea sp. AC32]|nr:carboxymuconolactone decarboxylase family protein [Actinotalea sp. AC32]